MRTAYLKALSELAAQDKNVYALISDNGAIVYDDFRREHGDQYLNLGISEANMLGIAAGMASRGKIPFAYTIGSFLAYRAYEFIRNDICLQRQNVKIVGTGAGEVYSALGPTHHTTEDLGGLRSLPGLTIITPASPLEVYKSVYAAYEYRGPVYLRIGTNREEEIYPEDYAFSIGKAVHMREGEDLTVVSSGSILKDVLDVVDTLTGVRVRVLNIHTIKPLDEEAIRSAIEETGKILTIEDHNIIGGLGSAVAEIIAEFGKPVVFRRIGLHVFSHGYGTYSQVKDANGLCRQKIEDTIKDMVLDGLH